MKRRVAGHRNNLPERRRGRRRRWFPRFTVTTVGRQGFEEEWEIPGTRQAKPEWTRGGGSSEESQLEEAPANHAEESPVDAASSSSWLLLSLFLHIYGVGQSSFDLLSPFFLYMHT
nr:hypothetical protein Itr_chr12CG17250 [Ipomoea trifida]